jgi:hypothetical protein
VASSSAGKRTRCPSCSGNIIVPQSEIVEEDADSWLQLDSPSDPKPVPKQSSKPTQPTNLSKPEAGPKPAAGSRPGVESKSAVPTRSPIPQKSAPQKSDNTQRSESSKQSDSPLTTENGPKLGQSLFDDDLPELKPLDPELSPIPRPLMSEMSFPLGEELPEPVDAPTSPPKRSAPSDRSAEPTNKPVDEDFSFPCKVCGTLLYSQSSRAGTRTRCPDCHSELNIPSPPAKKKQVDFKIDPEVANVRLAPVESPQSRTQIGDSLKTKEILERAEKEAALERKEIDAVAAPFDSQRWLSLIFGFLRDPGMIFLSVVLGVCAAVCFAGLHAIGSLELSVIQKAIIRLAVFLCFGIPLLIGILMVCMVILPMAANRMTRVEQWPFGRFGEAIGELIMLAAALLIAALPGGFFASALALTGLPSIVGEIFVLLSIWGLTPLLLLSMIENNAITQPFSSVIFKSLGERPDSWGAMYFQSGMAIAGLFVVYAIGYVTHPMISAVFGLLFPLGLFFIANQYGVLAGRISDITSLGFEGDFSQDLEG